MQLIEIFLPMHDNQGTAFAPEYYTDIRHSLTEQFGGLTAFTRAPAQGLWKDSADSIAVDDIVIFEVMVEQFDTAWWQHYKTYLEMLFQQEKIIIRMQDIQVI